MCPICDANCRCRNRGPSGICCTCHKHTPKGARAHETEVPQPEVPGSDPVHLHEVRRLSDVLPLCLGQSDVPGLEGGRIRDSRDPAQSSWLTAGGLIAHLLPPL